MSGTHDGGTELQEVLAVLHLLGEDVCGVDVARNVGNDHLTSSHSIPNGNFSDVEVAQAFGDGTGLRPFHSSFVVDKQV